MADQGAGHDPGNVTYNWPDLFLDTEKKPPKDKGTIFDKGSFTKSDKDLMANYPKVIAKILQAKVDEAKKNAGEANSNAPR